MAVRARAKAPAIPNCMARSAPRPAPVLRWTVKEMSCSVSSAGSNRQFVLMVFM